MRRQPSGPPGRFACLCPSYYLCMYVCAGKRWQSGMLQAGCEMYRPDAEITSFTVASEEEVQFGCLERWRLEFGSMAGSCWRHLREKTTKPMQRKSARRATRQSIENFRVVIHVFRGADKVERKFHHSLHMEWPTATTNCCSSYVDLVIDFIYDE